MKWLCVLCMALLMTACVFMFFGVIGFDIKEPNPMETENMPALTNSCLISDTDSMLNVLNQRITHLEYENRILSRQNNELVSDFRQEINNIINKMNGWLGFWIGVAAIISIILPIIVQYTSIKNEREQFNNLIKAHKEDITRGIQDKIDNMRHRLNVMNNEIDKKHSFIDEQGVIYKNRLKIWRAQLTIENGIDSELMNPCRNTGSALNNSMWNNLTDSFTLLIHNEINAKPFRMENLHQLQIYLLDMSGYINKLRRGMIKKRSRRIDQVINNINTLFYRLDNCDYTNPSDFNKPFDELLTEFRNIRAEIEGK